MNAFETKSTRKLISRFVPVHSMIRLAWSRRPSVSWITLLAFASSNNARTSVSSFVPLFAGARSLSRFSSKHSTMASNKSVLVPIADGSEEIETTCITDTLTRFGAHVTVASVQPSLTCTMSRGIKIQADCTIVEAALKDWDLIVLPGGMPGAEHLRDSKELIDLLKRQKEGTHARDRFVRIATNGLSMVLCFETSQKSLWCHLRRSRSRPGHSWSR
jgi:hypothetical protein